MTDKIATLHTNPGLTTAHDPNGSGRTVTLDADADLQQLIDKISQRDESAFDQLYDRTVQRVYNLALRITRDQGAAEEVVGDVYFQVWNQANRFDHSRGNAMAWLMVITRSRALDLVRHNSRLVHTDSGTTFEILENSAENPMADESGPQDALMNLDKKTAVYAALKSLNETQRQLIALAFFRGYSHQELADCTGIALGTVKSHLKRSLSKLRTCIEGTADFLGDTR